MNEDGTAVSEVDFARRGKSVASEQDDHMRERSSGGQIAAAPKHEFLPMVQSDRSVQARTRKYFAFPEDKIRCMVLLSRRRKRGVYRDRHGRWQRDAMDAKAAWDGRLPAWTAKSRGP